MMHILRGYLLIVCPVTAVLASTPVSAQIAVRGATVHTMTGPPLRDGVVVIRNGKIDAVGAAGDVTVPDGFRVYRAQVVMPGLIDAHTVVGLAGYLNQVQDQDQIDDSEPLQPELRAIDAYNPDERLVSWIRQFGVTTIHTGHAPGAPITGQTMIAKTSGTTVKDAVIVTQAMVAVTLGEQAVKTDRSRRGNEPSKLPGTRSKVVALLRGELINAQNYAIQRRAAEEAKKPGRDLRMEVLNRVLDREIPLLITAHKAYDITTALRLAEEFNIRIVLDGASEAYLVLDDIRLANVPVIIHPTMMRAGGETKNASMETAARLKEAGVPFAFQSGYESYVPKTRVVLFEAAVAAGFGLEPNDTLSALTIDAATILGIADRVGSLEVGKDADLALYDGDPLEYTTHCTGVIINGQVVSDKPH